MATLQKAIKANTFSKWIKQIQIAELEKADIEGLEKCPFCPFATIMDTTPEENKCFSCLNPECGKKSCRLCQESYHAPLRLVANSGTSYKNFDIFFLVEKSISRKKITYMHELSTYQFYYRWFLQLLPFHQRQIQCHWKK